MLSGGWGVRLVCQRVSRAQVTVSGQVVGQIRRGWAVLVGVGPNDGAAEVQKMAEKLVLLRCFEDEQGKMNRSVLDVGGEVLLVSQFTLYADTSRGRRPGFGGAAPPEAAKALVERLAEAVRSHGIQVECGRFGQEMVVSLDNDGPVTMVLTTDGWG
jgi:D-tyrosyl-tRNA(Tyr) deacylase